MPVYLGLLVLGYLVGSVPTGLLIVKAARGVDIRKYGSGTIGTVNVLRLAGTAPALVVMLVDVLKGFLPTALAAAVDQPAWVPVLAGIASIAGHNWSVFLGFKGGKGVATTLGVLLGLSPSVGLLAAALWVLLVALTRYSSVGSMGAGVSVPVLMAALGQPPEYIAFGALAAAFGLEKIPPAEHPFLLSLMHRSLGLALGALSHGIDTTGEASEAPWEEGLSSDSETE